MDGATLLVKMLGAYGVDVIFGVPGETSIPLYGAIERSETPMRHLMARDERSAGYMADAYARVANRPALVEFPSGAGPLYGVAAIAESNQSSVPIVAITSDNPLSVEGRGFIASLECAELFKSITKKSIFLKSASKIPETIRLAFRIATTGKPGAVHITVPDNVYDEEVDPSAVSLRAERACQSIPAYPPRAPAADIERALELIAQARRPLVVAGAGVNRSGGQAALTQFAEHFQVPVATSMTGQQSIPDRHELCIGICGDNGFHPHANRALEESDLLLYAGCRIGSVVSMAWTFPPPRPGRRLVQVDLDPETLGHNTDNALSILSDARLFFEDLVGAAEARPAMDSRDPHWVASLNRWRQKFWDHADAQAETLVKANDLHPQSVIAALGRRLGAERLVFSDPGTPTPYLCRFLRLAGEDARLILNRAYGGLGYAIPAVVGGWCARPGVRPIGLFGDGSFGMSVGDLETIARLKVPALLIHFNNSGFAWIEAHKRTSGRRNDLPLQFSAVDAGALASCYGLLGLSAGNPQALEEALDAAFAHDGPVFLDCRVRSIADELPGVYSWLRKSGVDPLRVGGERLELAGPATGT